MSALARMQYTAATHNTNGRTVPSQKRHINPNSIEFIYEAMNAIASGQHDLATEQDLCCAIEKELLAINTELVLKPRHEITVPAYLRQAPNVVRSGFLSALAATIALSLLLFALPSYAQTIPPVETDNIHLRKEIALTQLASAQLDSVTSNPNLDAADSIRPFHIHVPEAALVDLRRRIAATRWPERETVTDQSQGVQLGKLQPLVRYWGTDYDWRKAETKLNALPQFVTTIDGVDIQFVHVRSRHPNALPLLMTHGWPGSIFELLKVIGPLTDPAAYGGRAEDAFDLVLPTWPGYGFSGKPTDTGWNPDRVGRAWAELMRRLGYTRYVSQGGDWGAIVSEAMARQALPGLLGIHVNMPATVPTAIAKALSHGDPAPPGSSSEEKAAFAQLDAFYKKGAGYAAIMNTRPQTLGYSLADSPVGMAAFYYDKFAAWSYSNGEPERAFTKDEMLDDITLYWLTNTGASSSISYWEVWGLSPFNAVEISIPVAVTLFPGEIYRAPRSWAEQNFHKLIYWNEVDKGGHFAAWEQPELFTEEVRAAFRSLR